MHNQSGKNDVLISAAIAARRARDRELENALINPSMVELFKTVLDHAFLLPLMELKLNQCTSFQGGQILTQQNLAQPFCFSSATPLLFGKTFISLEVTTIGENEFREASQELPYGRHLAYFERALSTYSCIDFGTGVCGTQVFIERAVLSSDQSVIERIFPLRKLKRLWVAAIPEKIQSFRQLPEVQSSTWKIRLHYKLDCSAHQRGSKLLLGGTP